MQYEAHCANCGHPKIHHYPEACVWRGSVVCGCINFTRPTTETY